VWRGNFKKERNRPEQWPWSSAAAHIVAKNDALVQTAPLLKLVSEPWEDYLCIRDEDQVSEKLRLHERTGRALGSDAFLSHLESVFGRVFKPKKAGRKRKIDKS
jgi:putative transposase